MSSSPQNVVVTAAGQSVGRAMAEKFLARGDNVHICDIDAKLLDQVLAANPKLGGTVCDVGDENQVARLFAEARDRMGPIDVLVNTVGIAGPRGPIETLSLADWRATMAANLDSMFLTIRQAVPDMKRRKRGAIVNFSTGSTKTVMPFRTPYVASKAGVELAPGPDTSEHVFAFMQRQGGLWGARKEVIDKGGDFIRQLVGLAYPYPQLLDKAAGGNQEGYYSNKY